jgi:hypothetical protein
VNMIIEEIKRSQERREAARAELAARTAAHARQSERHQTDIDVFLAACGATPTSTKDYARWLGAWIKQGGTIRYSRDRDFAGWLTPTRMVDLFIPTAYGSSALNLLVLEGLADVNMHPSSDDPRPGWEFGHGTVCRLSRSGQASTNKPDMVESFLDVEAILL